MVGCVSVDPVVAFSLVPWSPSNSQSAVMVNDVTGGDCRCANHLPAQRLDNPTWFRLLADPYICRWKDCNRGREHGNTIFEKCLGCSLIKFCPIDHLRCNSIYIPNLGLIDLSWDGTLSKFKKYVKGPFHDNYLFY